MRCCVPLCRNTTDNVSTSEGKAEITFYGFPSEVQLRAAWFRALGKQDTHLSNSAVVCSTHFLDDEMYETKNGIKQIYTGAVPSVAQVCMICLNTDRKLFPMSKHKFEEAYEKLTGYPLLDLRNLKPTVCVLCAQRLRNFRRFRTKCLQARSFMMDLVEKHDFITKQHIRKISRAKNQLKYNFVQTTLEPDHCDLHIVEADVSTQIVSEESVCKHEDIVIVKIESNHDSMLFDEHNEEISETNHDDEFFAASKQNFITDDSIWLDVKQLDNDHHKALKVERNQAASSSVGAEQEVGIQGPVKCERDYEDHGTNHEQLSMDQNSDSGNEDGTQLFGSQSAASSSCGSNHLTENKHYIQKLMDGHSADLTCSVATVTQAETIQKSSDLDNQPSGGIKKVSQKINGSTNCLVQLYDVLTNSKQTVQMKEEFSEIDDINPLHNDKKLFTCDICCIKFKRKSNLVQHIKAHPAVYHPQLNTEVKQTNTFAEVKTFSCMECQYKTKRKYNLTVHMKMHTGEKPRSRELSKFRSATHSAMVRTHTGEKPYSCKLCNYKCKSKRYLVAHTRTHTGERSYSCELCEYKSINKSHLLVHVRTHTGEKPYSCKFCNFKSANSSNLVQHMRTHTGVKPHSCKLCMYESINKRGLVIHMRTHTGEKPYSCELCKFKCVHNSYLVQHMRRHTDVKPYSCELCDYKSVCKSHLVDHVRTHTGEKPYSCKLCNFKSANSSNLKQHMGTHSVEKPYSCKLCMYKSVNKRGLVIHMRRHTVEKPFSCELCKYKCNTNSHLVQHMRRHTGVMPYSCELCEYKSVCKSHLVVHVRTHTGEKPYSCNLCNFKSASSSNLKQHMRTHTGENE